MATVKVDAVNVRDEPTTSSAVIGTFVKETPLIVKGRNATADWVQVILANQRVGWIRADLISLTVPINNLPLVP